MKVNEEELQSLITEFVEKYKTLSTDLNDTYFQASITGDPEKYKKVGELELELTKVLSDSATYAKVKAFKKGASIKNEVLARELEVLYNSLEKYQGDEKILEDLVKKGTALEQKYATYRATLNGEKIADNDIDSILTKSTSNEELKAAWLASKEIGDAVKDEVIELVKMRNELAQSLGYNNYHQMSLSLSEQDPNQIEALFDELDELTSDSFAKLKEQMDDYFAERYKVDKNELMPWHYQNRFFQEAPQIYNTDFDAHYKGKSIEKLVDDYFKGIGLPAADILERSDLYEKENKYQHAYCMHVDRSGDVRVVANIRANQQWTGTMLHELGHGVYDKFLDMDLPFLLREPAHIFTTEAIAMIFGRLATSPHWMKESLELSDEEFEAMKHDALASSQLQQLVFSRWSQVMFRFEKSMYENPDQDLNALWWQLIEKYQMLTKPEGRDNADWAAKIHIAIVPCYYHNYLMGELLASQFYAKIQNEISPNNLSMIGDEKIGEYFKTAVFEPAALYKWNDMIEKATGEKLTAKYYAEEFVK